MPKYQVAIGHDVALENLVDIDPQPRDGSIMRTRSYAIGAIKPRATRCVFKWNVLGTASQFQNLLSQFGIQEALSQEVTIFTMDEDHNWARYNGFAVQPEFGKNVDWDRFFLRRLEIYVNTLEELT